MKTNMTRETFGKKDFLGVLYYINCAVDIDIMNLHEEEDYFEIAELLVNEESTIDDVVEIFLCYDRVTFINLFLLQNDFIKTATELVPNMKKEMLKTDVLTFSLEFGETLYVISLNKIKVKRNRKTEVEYEHDLEVALKHEDYKEAARIRDKLKPKSEKVKSPTKSKEKKEVKQK